MYVRLTNLAVFVTTNGSVTWIHTKGTERFNVSCVPSKVGTGAKAASRNTRIWTKENPHTLHEVPLHPEKIGLSCAISRRRIV